MTTKFLKTQLPIVLSVVALFIVGSGCPAPDPMINYYPDADNDGYGDASAEPLVASGNNPPAGYVSNDSDCDDTNADINPQAEDIPDNLIDENCNGLFAITFYKDSDDDGFGDPNSTGVFEIELGDSAPNGFVYNHADCNDTNAAINPLADEIVGNDIDDNCDGDVDIFEVYKDIDGDGYGSNVFSDNGVHNNLDCDDNNDDIKPFIQERLDNGIDDNCNGITDEIN